MTKVTHGRIPVLALAALLLGSSSAFAQSLPAAAKSALSPGAGSAAKSQTTDDPFGRATPLGTVEGFLAAARQRNDQLASRYLNTKLRGVDAEDLAHRLFVVLDRRMPARLNQISDSPQGSNSDALPLNQDLVGRITSTAGTVDVILERVEQGKSGSVWLFSAETLAAVPALYDEVAETSLPERWLPAFLTTTRILNVPLIVWLMALVGIPLVYLLTAWPVRWLTRLAGRWLPLSMRWTAGSADSAERPFRLIILAVVIERWSASFALSLRARQFWADTAATISTAAIVWLLIIMVGRAERYLRARLAARNFVGAASVLRLGRWAVDAVVIFTGLFVMLHYFGVNPTAAVAGLGVGGIAVALAAQKTLENVIAGISLIADQAVQLGDVLKVPDCQGIVEDIGLRSTRIRTFDRTVVSVPNGLVANMSLETLSARDKFWLHPLIRLRCGTTVGQVRTVVEGVRTLLAEHPAMERGSVRVRFLGFGATSLDIDVWAYVLARDWNEFLEIQEGLLFRAMEIVEQAGTGIAIPAQITYHANAPGAAASSAPPAAEASV